MADEIINAVHRVRIVGRNHAGQTVNVLHFGQITAVFDNPDARNTFLTNLANAVRTCVINTLLPALPSDWQLEKITAQEIKPVLSDVVESVPDTLQAGALADSLPGFNSQMIQIKTGLGGKRKRGRIYCPPPPEGGVTQSFLTGPQLVLLVAFAACLQDAFVGPGRSFADAGLGIWSRTASAQGASINDAFTGATVLQAQNQVRRMGSRMAGKGS